MKNLSALAKVLLAVAVVKLGLTLVSLIETNRGLVRILDFVREPSIYLSALLALIALFFAKKGRWIIIGVLAVSAAINFARIWPYTALAPTEFPLPDDVDGMSCARALSLNVLEKNDQYDRVIALIEREKPDILLLMETNRTWVEALEPLLSEYGYLLSKPLDNRYGMTFATNLEVDAAQMVANTNADTPTLYATLRMEDGARFEMIGLHPRPPLPGESTESRDENISNAGARTLNGLDNVLVMGDFNDVPWSHTTSKFKAEGNYRDPRAGRGSFATFPADYVTFGWPLDQLFVKNNVRLESFRVLEDVGADHLPLVADVCVGLDEPAPVAPQE